MHICEFCHTQYVPRAQVKRPRACKNCQMARQRANEKQWHLAHKSRYDRNYHRVKTLLRMHRLREMAKKLCEWLKVGKSFFSERLDLEMAGEFFFQFLTTLGIRRANKLWGH